MSGPYDDILHLFRPVSRKHPPMTMQERAAQFFPFAALTGYADAVQETGRQTVPRRELDEQARAELDRKLANLTARILEHPEVTFEYFVPDARKAGGSYATVSGRLGKISLEKQTVTLLNGRVIPLRDIAEISF